MGEAEYRLGRTFLLRPEHGSEFLSSIAEFARQKDIRVGIFMALGALKSAMLAYYDQEKQTYRKIDLDSPCELASCLGNISLKGGQPFVHAHAVLADGKGTAMAGHLSKGKVFAAEVLLLELKGPEVERQPDKTTGLALWEFPTGDEDHRRL